MDLATPSAPQPRALDTRGSHCLWAGPVHHRGRVDRRVPAFADAKTKPQGLCQNREGEAPRGDASPSHTGPTWSRSHWVDPALEMKTTDREQPTAPTLQFPTPRRGRGRWWLSPRLSKDVARSDAGAE